MDLAQEGLNCTFVEPFKFLIVDVDTKVGLCWRIQWWLLGVYLAEPGNEFSHLLKSLRESVMGKGFVWLDSLLRLLYSGLGKGLGFGFSFFGSNQSQLS